MRKIKKLTSVFLAVIMVLGMLTVAPFSASATVNSDQLYLYKLLLKDIHDYPLNYVDLFNNNKTDIEKCSFAVADVNDDGTDELIVNYTETYILGMYSEIFTVNNYNQLVSLGRYGAYPEFYKYGYMVLKASHNQGPGYTIWPYSVYSYSCYSNKFNIVYSASCNNKDSSYNEFYNSYNPAEDLDHDGVIYVVNNEKLTKAQYDAYVNAYIPSKNKLNISWKKITNSNINNLGAPISVKLNRGTLTLGVGEKYGLIKTVSPSSANQACTWSSSNSSVASVDSSGKVTAKKSGTANITVKTTNGKTATCKVTVKPAPTSVKVNPASLTLGKGETYTISQSTNSGSYAWGFSWSSSNTSVATVTKGSANKATVTVKGVGTATITIKTYNGKTAQCKVTVKNAPTSVTTNPTSLILGKGEKYTISENTNSGAYANAANLKWSTTNSSVATVTKGRGNKATITAKGNGTAYIKISLYNGKTAQCKVTVKNAPSSVKTNPTSVTLGKGETYVISESTNSGAYANAANLKWTTTNSSVATVTKGEGNKAVITAKGVGTAYIKITLYNGKTAQCKVTVKNAPTSVKINPARITLGKGETYLISESTNSGAYANAANLKWSTTNPNVATVTKGSANKATITAKGIGTAYIKITLYNGKTAQCKVTVTDKNKIRDDFISKLLSGNYGIFDDAENMLNDYYFADLNYDGVNELFFAHHSNGRGAHTECDVYYYDNGTVKKAGGKMYSPDFSVYYNKSTGKYESYNSTFGWLGADITSTGRHDKYWYGNSIISFDGNSVKENYYSSIYRIDDSYTYYQGAKSYKNSDGCKKITKTEYNKLNSDNLKNKINANAKYSFVDCKKWNSYSYSQKKTALLNSYNSFKYDRY